MRRLILAGIVSLGVLVCAQFINWPAPASAPEPLEEVYAEIDRRLSTTTPRPCPALHDVRQPVAIIRQQCPDYRPWSDEALSRYAWIVRSATPRR